MFESLQPSPADPILKLTALYRADTHPYKVDLGPGVYKDEQGHTPIMRAVTAAQEKLLMLEDTKSYVGMAGWTDYSMAVAKLTLGESSQLLADNRVALAQTPGGTGALRVLSDFIHVVNAHAKIWLGNPTWANHKAIVNSAGLDVAEYPYFDAQTHGVDFDGMMTCLSERAKAGDVVMVHGCCHNPSGADLSVPQWQAFTDLVVAKGLVPFVDIAYQGMGDGMEEDAAGLRLLAESVEEMVIASSCSKNFGLYRERTGTAMIVAKNSAALADVQDNMNAVIRGNYSMPPSHGALVVQTILSDEALRLDWQAELTEVRTRIAHLRTEMVQSLKSAGITQDFGFIEQQKGMFSFLGINKDQVDRLVNEYSIYLVSSSRINVAGLNSTNMERVSQAIAAVL